MENSKKVQAALEAALKELNEMTPEQFKEILDKCSEEAIVKILEDHECEYNHYIEYVLNNGEDENE